MRKNDEVLLTRYREIVADDARLATATPGQREAAAQAMLAAQSDNARDGIVEAATILTPSFVAADLDEVLRKSPSLLARAPSAESIYEAEAQLRIARNLAPLDPGAALNRIRELRGASDDTRLEAAAAIGFEAGEAPAAPPPDETLAKAQAAAIEAVAPMTAQGKRAVMEHVATDHKRRESNRAVQERLQREEAIRGSLDPAARLTLHRAKMGR